MTTMTMTCSALLFIVPPRRCACVNRQRRACSYCVAWATKLILCPLPGFIEAPCHFEIQRERSCEAVRDRIVGAERS